MWLAAFPSHAENLSARRRFGSCGGIATRWGNRLATAILCLAGMLIAITPAGGQELSDPVFETLHQRMSRFLEQLSAGTSVPTAYDDLFSGGPLSARKNELDDLITKTEKIGETYGPYREFERVYSRRIGTDLVFMKYLYKCQRFPVLWHVTFYRPPERGELGSESGGAWQVIAIRFDTNLEVLTLLKN